MPFHIRWSLYDRVVRDASVVPDEHPRIARRGFAPGSRPSLAEGSAPIEPIAPRVDEAAAALGALVWDADRAEGEAAVVCFALDADETG